MGKGGFANPAVPVLWCAARHNPAAAAVHQDRKDSQIPFSPLSGAPQGIIPPQRQLIRIGRIRKSFFPVLWCAARHNPAPIRCNINAPQGIIPPQR